MHNLLKNNSDNVLTKNKNFNNLVIFDIKNNAFEYKENKDNSTANSNDVNIL